MIGPTINQHQAFFTFQCETSKTVDASVTFSFSMSGPRTEQNWLNNHKLRGKGFQGVLMRYIKVKQRFL